MAIQIVPGDTIGANIAFDYRGPAARYWIGFGIAWQRSRDQVYRWIGSYVNLSAAPNWEGLELRVEGTLPYAPPHTDQHHECYAFIGTGPGAGEIEGEWTDDVFMIRAEAEFRNLDANYFAI